MLTAMLDNINTSSGSFGLEIMLDLPLWLVFWLKLGLGKRVGGWRLG